MYFFFCCTSLCYKIIIVLIIGNKSVHDQGCDWGSDQIHRCFGTPEIKKKYVPDFRNHYFVGYSKKNVLQTLVSSCVIQRLCVPDGDVGSFTGDGVHHMRGENIVYTQ